MWSYKGMSGLNRAAPLVYEYSVRKSLSKLGFTFDTTDLNEIDVEYLTLIASEYNRLEAEDMKRSKKR